MRSNESDSDYLNVKRAQKTTVLETGVIHAFRPEGWPRNFPDERAAVRRPEASEDPERLWEEYKGAARGTSNTGSSN